jgi:hypothetical protein
MTEAGYEALCMFDSEYEDLNVNGHLRSIRTALFTSPSAEAPSSLSLEDDLLRLLVP